MSYPISECPEIPRKTKAEVARIRDRIVGRAQESLSWHGMTNPSVGQVAKEADVTRGSVPWPA